MLTDMHSNIKSRTRDGRNCSMKGMRSWYKSFVKYSTEMYSREYFGAGGCIILKRIWAKWAMVVWNEFIWIRTGY